ncbi:MAG: hypothetical protein DMG57_33710 [Acidobacteria bacterium]|nr:MAG: hypothetical protein DMG57_33710 [Acidobacteriota bacterium]
MPAGSSRAAFLPIAPSAIHQYGARRQLKSANGRQDLNLRNKTGMSARRLIREDENVRNSSAVAGTKEPESDFAKQTQFFLKLNKQRHIYPL